jgi:fatty acid desaturase
MESIVNSNLPAEPISGSINEFLKSAKPKTHRTVFDLIFNGYLRIACGLMLFKLFPNPAIYLLSVYIITSGMGVLVNLSHESQHSALLKNKRANDFVGAWLCAYPVGSIWGSSRAVHLAHHKYLNTTADPDRHFHNEQDKSDPAQFALYLVKLVLGGQLWTSIIVNGFLREKNNKQSEENNIHSSKSTSALVVMPRRSHPEILNLIPVQASVFAIFWLVTGFWWAYFALWLVPIFTLGTLLGYIRGFIDHARLATDDEVLSEGRLISVPLPSWIDRLFFTGLEFHFHAEHHFFPSVPHYYLPQLHKLLQSDDEYRQRYLLRPSYTSFLIDYFKQISRGEKSSITERIYERVSEV